MLVDSFLVLTCLLATFSQPGEALSSILKGPSSAALALESPLFFNSYFSGMVPSFVNHPSFERFREGSVPLVCIPNAINDPSKVCAWKADAKALQSLAFGASAGVASGQDGIRSGVHQIWLQSPGSSTSTTQANFLVGDIDARKELLRFVDTLRACLNDGLRRNLPPELLEISYLLYDANGAAYARHVDSFADVSGSNRKRCVSFILYLGSTDKTVGDTNEQGNGDDWDCTRDGGALRIHEEEFASFTGQPLQRDPVAGRVWSDIAPQPGTVVLFDSACVPHEVVSTRRGRACVVGWMGTYQ